jgi:outer membrane protein OmpA-like peptidoglycan-associated protein
MNKTNGKGKGGLVAGLILCWVFSWGGVRAAAAADCKALVEAIVKERTLMTRKIMIEDAMKVCPRDAEIVYQHGYTLERLRKYDDALRSYKKAIGLDSGYSKAFFSIGDIQMIMKNYEDAAQAYESGLQHEPGDARAVASLQDARNRYKDATGKALAGANLTASSKSPAEKPVELKPDPKVESKPEPKVEPKVEEGPAQVATPILRLQVPFVNSSTDLSQEAQDVLSVVVGQAMRRKDMQASRFEIGGHTDNLGDPAKNLEISRQRAEAVQKYLTENFGIASERLQVASYGQTRPRVPNTSPGNQELNRRVEFSKIK